MTNHTTTRPVALPTIHLNGTGAIALRDEYCKVRKLAAATADALAEATCNGRDFYPQGSEAFQQAQADRREMFRLLEVVKAFAEAWEDRAEEALPTRLRRGFGGPRRKIPG